MERPEDLAEDARITAVDDDESAPGDAERAEAAAEAAQGRAGSSVELDAEEAQIVEDDAPPRRPRWPLFALLAFLAAIGLVVFLLTGGAGEEGQRQGAATSQLRITLDADGDGPRPSQERVVRCPSQRWRDVCRQLGKLPAKAFRQQRPSGPCTELYGGPDRVTVRGRWHGREVAVDLARTNGCEIKRFERWSGVLRQLFPRYRPGAAMG